MPVLTPKQWLLAALALDVLTYVALSADPVADWKAYLVLDLFLFWRVSKGGAWAYWILAFLQALGLTLGTILLLLDLRTSGEVSTNATWWSLLCVAACLACLFTRHEAAKRAARARPLLTSAATD